MNKITVGFAMLIALFAANCYAENTLPRAQWYCYFNNSGEQAKSAAIGFDKATSTIQIIASVGDDTNILHYYHYQVTPDGAADLFKVTAATDFTAVYDKQTDEITVLTPVNLQHHYQTTACDY